MTRRKRRLSYSAPFEGGELLEFLARRAVPGVEEMLDGGYRRSLRLPRGAGVIELEAGEEVDSGGELEPGRGHVQASYWLEDPRDLPPAVKRSRMLLDLDADPQAVLEVLGSDELLGPLVRTAPGRRVPRHVDPHELAVRAVLGQQVSVTGAATLAARLVAQYGEPLSQPVGSVTHLFPSASALAEADEQSLAMPSTRRRALKSLAASLAGGELVLEPGVDREQTRRQLLALPGIGPWTADYIAMRALGDSDAFLASDLGVRHALTRLGQDGRPAAAKKLAERWHPYRAYAFQHLLAQLP